MKRSNNVIVTVTICLLVILAIAFAIKAVGRLHQESFVDGDYTGGNQELGVKSLAGELLFTPKRTLYIMPSGPSTEIKMSYGDTKTLNIAQNKVDIFQPLEVQDTVKVSKKDAEFYGPRVLVSEKTRLEAQGGAVLGGVVSLSNVKANGGDIYIDAADRKVNMTASRFDVGAPSAFNSSVAVSSDLTVNKNASISGSVNITKGGLTVADKATFNADVSVARDLNVAGNATLNGIVSVNGNRLNVGAQSTTVFESRPEFRDGIQLDRIWMNKNNVVSFMSPSGNALASVLNTGDIRMNSGACLGTEATGLCFNSNQAQLKAQTMNVSGNLGMGGKLNVNGLELSKRQIASGSNYLAIDADGLMFSNGTIISTPSSASINVGDWRIVADGNKLTFKLKNADVAEIKTEMAESNSSTTSRNVNNNMNSNVGSEFKLYHIDANARSNNNNVGSVFFNTRANTDISLTRDY